MTTDDRSKPNAETPPSELEAAEAYGNVSDTTDVPSPPDSSGDSPSTDGIVTCPNCGRAVEPGFRFCDGCGTNLETARPATEPPAPVKTEPEATPPPAAAPAAAKREPEATKPKEPPPSTETVPDAKTRQAPDVKPDEAAPPEESVPLLERWRRRRAERSALGKAERALADGPQTLEAPADVTAPVAQPRAPGATSKPKTAEELHGARPLIGGRLQWAPEDTDTTADTSEATAQQPTWRPVPIPEAVPERAGGREAPRFVLHFLIAFMAGGIALLALAALASVVSDGRVSLLESRGLPIFIGGAVSIVVFALLRTSESRSDPARTRRGVILGVVAGLLGLVVLAAVLYQPAVAGRLQPRIERVLRVFSTEDERAVEQFERSVIEWHQAAEDYHDSLEVALRERGDPDRLRGSAAQAETTLEGINSQMRTSAESAQQPELRDALSDLASIYEDQLGGLRVVNRGLLVDNIDLVRTGDASFKDAHERATTLFQSRLRPLLVRAGLDAQSFGNAIAG